MLKLVSNKNGDEVHHLEMNENNCQFTTSNGDVIQPSEIEDVFVGIIDILKTHGGDKKQLLSALTQLNSEYFWAVTFESTPFKSLTRRQFKLTLLENGLLDHAETAINAIEDVAVKTRMQIEYSESVVFERASPAVLQMCGLLGLTSEQVDAMWAQALTL